MPSFSEMSANIAVVEGAIAGLVRQLKLLGREDMDKVSILFDTLNSLSKGELATGGPTQMVAAWAAVAAKLNLTADAALRVELALRRIGEIGIASGRIPDATTLERALYRASVPPRGGGGLEHEYQDEINRRLIQVTAPTTPVGIAARDFELNNQLRSAMNRAQLLIPRGEGGYLPRRQPGLVPEPLDITQRLGGRSQTQISRLIAGWGPTGVPLNEEQRTSIEGQGTAAQQVTADDLAQQISARQDVVNINRLLAEQTEEANVAAREYAENITTGDEAVRDVAREWDRSLRPLQQGVDLSEELQDNLPDAGVFVPSTPPPPPHEPTRREAQIQEVRALFQTNANLGQIPGGATAVENVTERLKTLGMSYQDLTRVQVEASTGASRWSATQTQANGVVVQATITTDKYGNVLKDMGTRFRSFWSTVARDLTKVVQWGIAVGVIYGSMRKFNELIKEAIEIQSKLADVQIALASTTSNVNTIFDTANRVAREFGTSVTGVIDGYLMAYRATGEYRSEAERTRVATILLSDSMMLAKLSGMDQAVAMDTLVAALKQLGWGLDQGGVLLDKWVAVTRIANVNLQTLATSFSIVAAAATGVGTDVDKLNGIIAAFAEVTPYSAEEVANAVRGFIAGFQSRESEDALARYGIAVRNTSGDLRNFEDVLTEIASKRALNILSEEQLSAISNIMGGGWRRGAQLKALLENWSRVGAIATVSAAANGEAQRALAIKMDTVKTALTNLANAFSSLSRALGYEGGFLDLIQKGVEFLTNLVDGLTALTKTLGKSIPVIIAFAAAWAFVKSSAFGNIKLALGAGQQLGPLTEDAMYRQMLGGGMQGTGLGIGLGARGALTSARTGLQGVITGLQQNIIRNAISGLGMGVLSTILTGEMQRAWRGSETSAARVGITLAGSAIGTILTGSPMIGAIIGQVAGQSLVKELGENVGGLQNLFASLIAKAIEDANPLPPTPPPTEDEAATLLAQGRALIESGRSPLGLNAVSYGIAYAGAQRRARGDVEAGLRLEPGTATDQQIDEYITAAALLAISGWGDRAANRVVLGDFLANLFEDMGRTPELRQQAQDLIRQQDALSRRAAAEEGQFQPGGIFYTRIQAAGAMGGIATQRVEEERRTRYAQYSRREIPISEYSAFLERAPTVETAVNTLYAALGDSAQAIMGADSATDAYGRLVDVVLGLSPDELRQINSAAYEVGSTLEMWAADPTAENLQARNTELREYQDLLSAAIHGQAFTAFEAPTPFYLAEGTTEAQAREWERRTREGTQAWVEALAPNDPAGQQKLLEAFGDMAVLSAEEFDRILNENVEGLSPEIATQIAEDMGIAAQMGMQQINFGWQQPGIPAAQMPTQGQVDTLTAWLERQSGGRWQPNAEDIGLIGSDKQVRILHGDNLVISMLLQDIKNLNEQQLEGVFNLPADMAALVPMTGQLYFSTSPINQGGGLGGFDWRDLLGEPADNLDGAAIKLDLAATKLLLAGTMYNPTIGVEIPGAGDRYGAGKIARMEAAEGNLSTILPYSGSGKVNKSVVEPNFMDRLLDIVNSFLTDMGGHPMPETGGRSPGLQSIMPASIPITNKITLDNRSIVYVDGQKIVDILQKRNLVDLKTAMRRTGTVSYDVST